MVLSWLFVTFSVRDLPFTLVAFFIILVFGALILLRWQLNSITGAMFNAEAHTVRKNNVDLMNSPWYYLAQLAIAVLIMLAGFFSNAALNVYGLVIPNLVFGSLGLFWAGITVWGWFNRRQRTLAYLKASKNEKKTTAVNKLSIASFALLIIFSWFASATGFNSPIAVGAILLLIVALPYLYYYFF